MSQKSAYAMLRSCKCTYVDVVHKIVANRQINPLILSDHLGALSVADSFELVSWANSTSEKDLRGTECTGSKDDSLVGLDGSSEAIVGSVRNLNSSDLGSLSDDSLDNGVGVKREVGAGVCRSKVYRHGSAAFAVLEHVRGVGVDSVLLVRNFVGTD